MFDEMTVKGRGEVIMTLLAVPIARCVASYGEKNGNTLPIADIVNKVTSDLFLFIEGGAASSKV